MAKNEHFLFLIPIPIVTVFIYFDGLTISPCLELLFHCQDMCLVKALTHTLMDKRCNPTISHSLPIPMMMWGGWYKSVHWPNLPLWNCCNISRPTWDLCCNLCQTNWGLGLCMHARKLPTPHTHPPHTPLYLESVLLLSSPSHQLTEPSHAGAALYPDFIIQRAGC